MKKKISLDIPKTLRSEFHFLKFPFFDLSPRTCKKDKIEIKKRETAEEGEIEILWKVVRGLERDFPSILARKIHKKVIEKTINKFKKPIFRLVKLGSLRQICNEMNITKSGRNFEKIKKALKDIKSAEIEAKGTFRQKEKNGGKKFFEGTFNLYDALYFTGEVLPDGREADAVYVLLNDMYVQNFNYNFVVPLDYHYFQSLKGDIASRMYEVLNIWFYPILENRRKYIQKEYLELCSYFPLTRQATKKRATGQLKKAHKQHVGSGFLACEPEWIDIGKKDNWGIVYRIGEKAKEWYEQNKRKSVTGEEPELIPERVRLVEELKKEKRGNPLIVRQLVGLGVTEKVAQDLANKSNQEKIKDWIEVIPATNPKDKAAFLVKAIQEEWELPEPYRNKKEARIKDSKDSKEAELKKQYNIFIVPKLDPYFNQMDESTREKEYKEHEKRYINKYPFYKQFEGKESIRPYVMDEYRESVKKKLGHPSYEEWKKGQEGV